MEIMSHYHLPFMPNALVDACCIMNNINVSCHSTFTSSRFLHANIKRGKDNTAKYSSKRKRNSYSQGKTTKAPLNTCESHIMQICCKILICPNGRKLSEEYQLVNWSDERSSDRKARH